MELRKGQKIPIEETFLSIKFSRKSKTLDIDTAAFLLTDNDKVGGDDDFVFYGNAVHNSGCIIHREDDSLKIYLNKIPQRIKKISFTATIYDADNRQQNFSQLGKAVLQIKTSRNKNVANFPLENFSVETAIVLGEIYRYKDGWKFNAIGAGFSGGLAALCENFGIEVKDEQPEEETPPPIVREEIPPPTIQETPPPPIVQEEISPPQTTPLKYHSYDDPTFEITEHSDAGFSIEELRNGGPLVVKLTWDRPTRNNSPSRFSNRQIDLDLGCLYEFKDGEIGAVQSLGKLFGHYGKPPYIRLEGDNRTGDSCGEIIRINGKFSEEFSRILIFVSIYSGASNWKELKPVITISNSLSPKYVLHIDEHTSKKPTYAAVLFQWIGDIFFVDKIGEFYYDSQEMDEALDWGLQWTTGSKN